MGNDVFLRYVVELPTLLTFGDHIDLVKWTFVCSNLNCTFPLILNTLDKRLSNNGVFNNSTPTIPQEVATNIRRDSSLIHYISAECRALSIFSTTYSYSIIVYNKCFRGFFTEVKIYFPLKNCRGCV